MERKSKSFYFRLRFNEHNTGTLIYKMKRPRSALIARKKIKVSFPLHTLIMQHSVSNTVHQTVNFSSVLLWQAANDGKEKNMLFYSEALHVK
jgi:hypothetical protein